MLHAINMQVNVPERCSLCAGSMAAHVTRKVAQAAFLLCGAALLLLHTAAPLARQPGAIRRRGLQELNEEPHRDLDPPYTACGALTLISLLPVTKAAADKLCACARSDCRRQPAPRASISLHASQAALARAGLPYQEQAWYNLSIPAAPRGAGQALQNVADLLPAVAGGAGASAKRVSAPASPRTLTTQARRMIRARSQGVARRYGRLRRRACC